MPPPEAWHEAKAGQDLPDLDRLATIHHSVESPEEQIGLALVKLEGLHHQLPNSSWQQGTTIDLSGGLPVVPVVDVGEVVAIELLPETAKAQSNQKVS